MLFRSHPDRPDVLGAHRRPSLAPGSADGLQERPGVHRGADHRVAVWARRPVARDDVRVPLEVVVGGVRVPRLPHVADDVAGLHRPVGLVRVGGQVGVVDVAVRPVDVHRVAAERVPARSGRPREGRPDRRAHRGDDVVAGVGVVPARVPGRPEPVVHGSGLVDRADLEDAVRVDVEPGEGGELLAPLLAQVLDELLGPRLLGGEVVQDPLLLRELGLERRVVGLLLAQGRRGAVLEPLLLRGPIGELVPEVRDPVREIGVGPGEGVHERDPVRQVRERGRPEQELELVARPVHVGLAGALVELVPETGVLLPGRVELGPGRAQLLGDLLPPSLGLIDLGGEGSGLLREPLQVRLLVPDLAEQALHLGLGGLELLLRRGLGSGGAGQAREQGDAHRQDGGAHHRGAGSGSVVGHGVPPSYRTRPRGVNQGGGCTGPLQQPPRPSGGRP